jgi:hypothetical protein
VDLVKYTGHPYDVTLYKEKECWRCQCVLTGDGEVHQKHCPRCAHEVDGLIDMDELTEDQIADRRSWQAATDLGLIYLNWSNGYIRLMNESNEADYSSLDDFITEVMEHSLLYLRRLRDTGILNDFGLAYVRGVLNESTLNILNRCEELYLEANKQGRLGENDEEIRKYWLKRLARQNGAIRSHEACRKTLCYEGSDTGGE